ncbi:hydrolase [Mesorhizobium sp. Root157]|uniref:TIGR01458 family HAD-type hydrolase n=1 Tax=Mesorhizobium sp. Root157 TaxID=1736477 RepID=UPI0006F25D7C|nr:TIGR01458 family HAD-type hydrolase [Mesorhizobium sp. Root157]KQZ93907.1 hydrolase [Mesorhizobium sp. Root157]
MLRGVLLDLAGVVYDGDTRIPGAAGAIRRLRAAGLAVRFVSNTTRSPRQTLVEQLAGFGIGVAGHELITPAAAAIAWLRLNKRTPLFVVHPKLRPEFEGLPFAGKPAVVVGDAGETFDYAVLNEAFRQLMAGADLVALANNRMFKDRDGLPSMDAGAFVAALEFASGVKATVIGKPASAFFQAALRDMGCAAPEVAMVGDDAESDVAGALSAGLGAALLVRTGKYRPGDEARFDPPPTAVVKDLAAAADWLLSDRA